jgi:hypothetical protein
VSAAESAAGPAGRGVPVNGIVIGAVVVAILAALWFFGRAERDVQRSAVGFAGLVEWLDDNGVEARAFTGGGFLVEGEVGLRILPLYDTDPDSDRTLPETPEELIAQTSENDLPGYVAREKIRLLPTLVILPKWRTGMRMLGVAHHDLLIPEDELDELVAQRSEPRRRVVHDPSGWSVAGSDYGMIGLHHAQTLADSGCQPIIGSQAAMLLGRCKLGPSGDKLGPSGDGKAGAGDDDGAFWLLADPDLMDNHGLALAGNAGVALDFVREAAGGGPVVLDLSDHVATVDPDWLDEQRERSWEDLARLVEWPFGVVWIAFAGLAALVLWRALVRYGPVEAAEDGEAMRASREVSIDAKARLLRLADHDAALMRLHFASRLQQLAAELLGPHRPAGADPLALLTGLVGRRRPELARELADSARLPDAPRGRVHARPGDLLGRLDRFEDCIVRIRDEFGRAAGAGG